MKPSTNRKRWARILERRTGYLVALLIVPTALMAMRFIYVRPVTEPEPERMKVLYEFSEPEPEPPEQEEPEEETRPVVDPQTVQVAATRQDSQEMGELILDPSEGEEAPEQEQPELEEVPQPEEKTVRDWVPTTQDAAELQTIMEEVTQTARRLNRRQEELQEKITRAEVVSAAKQFKLDSDGGLKGAIRLLDVEKFPDNIVMPVLKRYGIGYERRFTKPSGGRRYLNAASTERGTFRNVDKQGFYEVMTLSAKALAYMSKLETEALQDHGYNPRNSRVRKIVFTIVKRDGRYDLGVSDLDVEKVR